VLTPCLPDVTAHWRDVIVDMYPKDCCEQKKRHGETVSTPLYARRRDEVTSLVKRAFVVLCERVILVVIRADLHVQANVFVRLVAGRADDSALRCAAEQKLLPTRC
jgi:hypothetical protein